LTAPGAVPIVMRMATNQNLSDLGEISARLDRLLELCQRLGEENRSLRVSQEQLAGERANLMAKNEQARSRVEAMINRLKSLEQNG
jgi:cell division protein ZapB